MLCCGWGNSNPKAGKSVIPDLSGEVLGWISQAQTQCLRVCNIPSLAAPVGISQGTCPVWKILVPVLVWLLLTLPFRIAQCRGRGSPGWLWALSSICIPAVGIISGAEREGAHAVPFPSWTSLGPVAFSFLFY